MTDTNHSPYQPDRDALRPGDVMEAAVRPLEPLDSRKAADIPPLCGNGGEGSQGQEARQADDAWFEEIAVTFLANMFKECTEALRNQTHPSSGSGAEAIMEGEYYRYLTTPFCDPSKKSVKTASSGSEQEQVSCSGDPLNEPRGPYHYTMVNQAKDLLSDLYTNVSTVLAARDPSGDRKSAKRSKKDAKANVKSMLKNGKKELRSCFSRESFNCVIDIDALTESPVKPPVPPASRTDPTQGADFTHFPESAWQDSQLQVTSVSVTKQTAIADVFKFEYQAPQPENVRSKYRPKPAEPLLLETSDLLRKSLQRHGNFSLTGKAAAPPAELPANDSVSATKTDIYKVEMDKTEQATQFVLRLHQEKKERMQKRFAQVMNAANQGLNSVQQMQTLQAIEKHSKQQRLMKRIEEINQRKAERQKVNALSNQLIRLLQMDKNIRKEEKEGLQSGKDAEDPKKQPNNFFFQPLEQVLTPKNIKRPFSKTAADRTQRENRDWEGDYRQINAHLTEKLNKMESRVTMIKEKRAIERSRMRQILGLRAADATNENQARPTTGFSVKRNSNATTIVKAEDSQKRSFRLAHKSAAKVQTNVFTTELNPSMLAPKCPNTRLAESTGWTHPRPMDSTQMSRALRLGTAELLDHDVSPPPAATTTLPPLPAVLLNPWRQKGV